METKLATIKDIRDYFNYKTAIDFMADWKKLTEEEKIFFKEGVGKEINTLA